MCILLQRPCRLTSWSSGTDNTGQKAFLTLNITTPVDEANSPPSHVSGGIHIHNFIMSFFLRFTLLPDYAPLNITAKTVILKPYYSMAS